MQMRVYDSDRVRGCRRARTMRAGSKRSGRGQNEPEGAHEADDTDGHRDGAEGDEGHGDDEEVEHAPASGEREGGGRSERDGNLGFPSYSRGTRGDSDKDSGRLGWRWGFAGWKGERLREQNVPFGRTCKAQVRNPKTNRLAPVHQPAKPRCRSKASTLTTGW